MLLTPNQRRLAREIKVWGNLIHDNVQPLVGRYYEDNKALPAMVSLWQEYGNAIAYLQNRSLQPQGVSCTDIRLKIVRADTEITI